MTVVRLSDVARLACACAIAALLSSAARSQQLTGSVARDFSDYQNFPP